MLSQVEVSLRHVALEDRQQLFVDIGLTVIMHEIITSL